MAIAIGVLSKGKFLLELTRHVRLRCLDNKLKDDDIEVLDVERKL